MYDEVRHVGAGSTGTLFIPENTQHLWEVCEGGLCAQVPLAWVRTRLRWHLSATAFLAPSHHLPRCASQICQEAGPAVVVAVRGNTRSRQAPAPLSTLEMQKRTTSKLRLPGKWMGSFERC